MPRGRSIPEKRSMNARIGTLSTTRVCEVDNNCCRETQSSTFLLQYFSKTGKDSGEPQRIREDSASGLNAEQDNTFRRKATCHRGLERPHPKGSSPVLLASKSLKLPVVSGIAESHATNTPRHGPLCSPVAPNLNAPDLGSPVRMAASKSTGSCRIPRRKSSERARRPGLARRA